ncbi:hydroxypyruvate reductase [Cenarchaeum symbiosum A]|uniref:Hydroxypyruvate reductase n=1 Tax=Cenarchaeum symbiosum (strain A) TaxID=414004 RepID=A0RVR5_CENSY|nr:hydroxypyruvate reductase [Cenarchaeum symbiosum A]
MLEAGLAAASPEAALGRVLEPGKITAGKTINLEGYSGVHVVAFGKSAYPMAKEAYRLLKPRSCLAVIPQGSGAAPGGRAFTVIRSSHPVPGQDSVAAARAVQKILHRRRGSEFVLFLVSGGSSSLLCMPDGISLDDKAYTSELMLKSGATIQEFNCVRKHLSQVKGGRLVAGLPCDAAALVMSDVVGDDLSSIASGTTYCDATTYSNALDIVRGLGLADRMPPAALARLEAGARGGIPETPKEPMFPNWVIAANRDCTAAMGSRAREFGYEPEILSVSGDVSDAAGMIAERYRQGPPCVIFGGETTVRVKGDGRGGRNQELVLRLLRELKGESFVAASIGTDGIDGNTEDAGAISGGDAGIDDIDAYLAENDSGSFFAKHGGQVKTGYTRTNLMDIGLVLRPRGPDPPRDSPPIPDIST